VRFEEVRERDRLRSAVEVAIERVKRVDFAATEAVRVLIEAAEGNAEVLLELGGTDADNDQPDDQFARDPLMTYVNRLVDAAAGCGPVPTVDPADAVVVKQERRFLNAPHAEAFAELCQLVPGLSVLEAELKATGTLSDPTERRGWRQALHRRLSNRAPMASFFVALRPRLAPLVGQEAPAGTIPLARTFIAYEVAWDHLRSVAGYPPERRWDELRPPVPSPQEAIDKMRQTYRERRRR
jgi:hypothetical protein